MLNYVDVRINLEVAISLVQSEAGNRLRLDAGAWLPWELHLAGESALDRGEAPSNYLGDNIKPENYLWTVVQLPSGEHLAVVRLQLWLLSLEWL